MIPREALLLTAGVAVVGANSLVLSPIAGAVAASFQDTSPADVMAASAVYGLCVALSALAFAPLADRLGAKSVLLRALTGLALALGISAAAPSLWVLAAAQGLAGLAAGVALPAIYGLAAHVAPKGRESETIGIVLTGWTISLVAGVSLSAVFADLVHWRGVFALLAALCVPIVLALGRMLTETPRGEPTSPLGALRVHGILRTLSVCAAYMLAFYGLYTYLGAHLVEGLNRSTAAAGLVPLAYGLGFGAAAFMDRFIDRFGAARIAVPVFALLAGIYASLAVAAWSFWLLVALSAAWGLVNHFGLNLIVARLVALDPAQRGAIMGLNSAVTYSCVFLGAVLFRPVLEAFGIAGCALASALCVTAAMAASLRAQGKAAGAS